MTTTHYLRVEGVNLGNFVFDTRDLSTIRGGSLLLLDAIEDVIEALKGWVGNDKVRVLSQGASSGLFEIETDQPANVAQKVRETLSSNPKLRHATFVVDVIPASPDFLEAVESLLAANRWRQMQASSLAIPEWNTVQGNHKPACALNGLLPAVPDEVHAAPNRGRDTTAFISESVHARRDYGRKAKRNFYADILGNVATRANDTAEHNELRMLREALPPFAPHFEAIAIKKNKTLEVVPSADSTLSGKLAVFYADGNGFGKKQTANCTTSELQRAFDKYLRSRRESFLAEFLACEVAGRNKDDWMSWTEDESLRKRIGVVEVVRFETLLWGGDEVMFVMPARLGWRFATLFFAQMAGLNLREANKYLAANAGRAGEQFGDVPLTHSAALVFCHHHAPIHRIHRLAKEQMVEFAKRVPGGRDRDSLVVVVLESFDHLGTSYEDAMRRRYQQAVRLEDMIFAPTPGCALNQEMRIFADCLEKLRNSTTFPRSQLRELVRAMVADGAKAPELAAFDDAEQKISTTGDTYREPPKPFRNCSEQDKVLLFKELLPLFSDPQTSNPQALWLQLEELWDYALP